MKKLIALVLVLVMVLALAACGTETDPTDAPTNAPTNTPTNAPTNAPTDAPTDAPTEEPTDAPTEEPTEPALDNTLVEYYMQKANEVVVTDTHVIFTDDSGRGEISIEKNPENAAILYPSLACLWYETGATAPLLIGGDSGIELYLEQIGRDITQDPGVTIVSESSSGGSWDVEAILANNPDLIVCSMGMKGYSTIGATAEAANIPVIAIQYDHVQDYLKWFKVFCNISGHPEAWEEIANATAEKIIEVVSQVPTDVEAPKVAILGIVSGKLRAYGTEAAAGTILYELGGTNVFDDGTDSFESVDIDLEQLYAADPDIIVINQRGAAGATEEQLNEIVGGNPVWDGLEAVQEGIIFLEKGLFHNKPNHRYQEAYLVMAQILYPETFGELVTE